MKTLLFSESYFSWKKAEILNLDETKINFKSLEGEKGIILVKNLKWALPFKKTIPDRFKVGDIIFIKKENNFLQK